LHLDQGIIVWLYRLAPIRQSTSLRIEILNTRIGALYSDPAEAAKE
jgi:hypothetical protein